MNISTGSLPPGFVYVPQDNYILYKPETNKHSYLYADSATSCIHVIAVGKDIEGRTLTAVSHLSCEVRFKAFFGLVESRFSGDVAVYAAGANPPHEPECIKTARVFMKQAAEINNARFTVALGSGLPNDGCGALGIDVNLASPDYLTVSNKYFHLPDEAIRDPEQGANILFCKHGLRTGLPSLVLRDMTIPLTVAEKAALIAEAKKQGWDKVQSMTDREILERYSTTPMYEPQWFAGNIRRAAEFMRKYK